MEKDADAYRTISEVAEALDIPPHVLRFWETKFPQVKPLKRGGGRRYYRRADTDLLRNIRRLLYDEGYTIRGVQRLLRVQGPAGAVVLLPSDGSSPDAEIDLSDGAALGQGFSADAQIDPDLSVDQRVLIATLEFVTSEIDACRTILDEASRSIA